jgi:hypothetical protein
MLRQLLSCELADCVSSIFLAVVPVLLSTAVPILPSYFGEHVEAECNAYEVPPIEKGFNITTIWSDHKRQNVTITCKEFLCRPKAPKRSGIVLTLPHCTVLTKI